MADKMRIPRLLRAAWGGGIILLNAFVLTYMVGFIWAFATTMTGIADSGLFGTPLDDERAFSAVFVLVVLAVLMSFAYTGLSVVHAFAWSDLSSDRKLVWTAILFAGAQPAALVYWYLHVWRRTARADESPRPLRQLPRVAVALLGLLSVLPILYICAFLLVIGVTIASAGESMSHVLWFLDILPVAHISIIVLCWLLVATFLVDVFRNPRLEGNARILWAMVIAFAGFVGWPVYWYMNMWRPAPAVPLTVTPSAER